MLPTNTKHPKSNRIIQKLSLTLLFFFFLAMNASLFVWACYVKKRKTIALFLRTSLYIGIILSTSDIVCGLAMVYISISTFFIEPSKEPYLSVDLSKLSPYWNAVRTLLFAFSVSSFLFFFFFSHLP